MRSNVWEIVIANLSSKKRLLLSKYKGTYKSKFCQLLRYANYRRLLRISWKDMRTNDSILEELSTNRVLLQEINKRKLKYVGHAVRNPKTDLMATILQGRVEGRRNRGRPPMSYMDNITAITGLTLGEVMHRSRERDDLHTVVANRSNRFYERIRKHIYIWFSDICVFLIS